MPYKKIGCAVLVALTLFLIPAEAQIRSATLTGTVRDSSGAVIPQAPVVITEQGTNLVQSTNTTESGQFTVPYLPAGTYTVAVSFQGFAPFKETDIAVSTAQVVRVDVQLTVGAVDTAVEVSAQAAQIQSESSTVSGATEARVIDAIPNLTQNPMFYAFLQNGVQPRNATAESTSINSFGVGVDGRRQYSAVGINGGRAFTNDIQLDGLPVMGGGYNEAAVIPNTEGLQEVRVISNNFSAEYGRGQGVISMSTKSGTNEFHGQGTYLLRNEALNANTNSNNANNLARRAFKVNEFGAALTGPIIKDKLFFSSSYHFLRFNQGVANLATVPTMLERVGNFSQTMIRDASGAPVAAQLYDPWSVTQLGTDLYQRTPIPNAIIPHPDPYGLTMYSYYPEPNRTPDDAFNTNNFSSGTVNTIRRHNLNNRVDYRLGNHSIYGSGGFYYGEVIRPRPFGVAPLNDAPTETKDKNPYAQIGDTMVLSPTLVLDVRYGITRIDTHTFGGNKSGFTDYDAFGVPKSTQSIMLIQGAAPVISPNSFSGGAGGGSNWSALTGGTFQTKQEKQASHALAGSITTIHGNWTHKVGAEGRVLLSNYIDAEQASVSLPTCCVNVGGNYTFEYLNAAGSSVPQNNVPVKQGINGAAILMGANVWWIQANTNLQPAFAQKYFALYSQNDWRASSKLTLNLGIRWDLQPGPTERYDRISSLDLTRTTPFGTPGGKAFAGSAGYSRNLWDTQWSNFGPRFGAAYQVKDGLVLRGGVGITYLPSNTGYFSGASDYGSSAFGIGTNMLPFGSNPQGIPVARFSDPAPIKRVVGANVSAPEIYGGGDSFFLRNFKNGRALQWNFFMEKAFGRTWFASMGYTGSDSKNLLNRNYPLQNLQFVPASTLADWRDQYIASNGATNPANVQVRNPWQPTDGALRAFMGTLGGATIPQSITMMPYPLLWGNNVNDVQGFASYHSFQARVNHTFGGGLFLEANYTWSKSLDFTTTGIEDGQGFNSGGGPNGPDLLHSLNNRKYSMSDQPHRFVVVAMYDLPFGTGKAFPVENPILRAAASDWQIAGVATMQAGMPFFVSGASTNSLLGRPNRVEGVPLEVPKELQRWYDGTTSVTLPCGRVITPQKNTFLKYNSCAFSGEVLTAPNGSVIPDVYWVGGVAQTLGDMRGPGRANLDMTVRRAFKIREKYSLELSGEAMNVLNSAQYNGNYNGGLGGTNLTTNASRGLKPGMGLSDTFGTMGVGTFDPRQVTLRLRFRF